MELILHAGMPKTGSTYISGFLNKNFELLKDKGILINTNFWGATDPYLIINNLITYGKKNKIKKIVLSCEQLFLLESYDYLYFFNFLKNLFDKIKVIIFLKRQDLFLESFWKEYLIHLPSLYKNFNEFKNNFKIPNYYNILITFKKKLTDNTLIIPFEKKYFYENDLLKTFLRLIGIEDFSKIDFNINFIYKNVKFNQKGYSFFATYGKIFHENFNNIRFFDKIKFLYNFLPELFLFNGKISLFDINSRIDFIKKYDEVNKKIAKEFLNKETLFEEDISEHNSSLLPPEAEISTDEILKIMFSLNLKLYKRLSILEQRIELLEKLSLNKKVAIFGLGQEGKNVYKFLKKYFKGEIVCIIDDYYNKKIFNKIPVVTTDDFLRKYQNNVDLVVYGKFQNLNPYLLPNLKIPHLELENIYFEDI